MSSQDNIFRSANVVWSQIGGEITNLISIGKDLIAFGLGYHVVLINLKTGENFDYFVQSEDRGDGVLTLAGHRLQNFFAYSEACCYPNIFVVHFPSFNVVSMIKGTCLEGYARIAFGTSSLMFAVKNIPDAIITIWDWRKGVKLLETESKIQAPYQQLLRSNLSKPLHVVNLGVNSKHLVFWDIYLSCKNCILMQYEAECPEVHLIFTDVEWSNTNCLFVVTTLGCIYTMNQDHCLVKIIDCEGTTPAHCSLFWCRNELYCLGPDSSIRVYIRKAAKWEEFRSFKPSVKLKKLIQTRSEYLVGLTIYEELVVIDQQLGSIIRNLTPNQKTIVDICLVQPLGSHFVILTSHNILSVMDVKTGEETCGTILNDHPIRLVQNPVYPYVAVSYEEGYVEYYSIFDSKKLHLMAQIKLCNKPITKLCFDEENGKFLIASNVQTGELFAVESKPGGVQKIKNVINVEKQVVDFAVVASETCLRIFVLPVTSRDFIAGNQIIRYCILDDDQINVKVYQMKNEELFIQIVAAVDTPRRDRIFYLVPFKSRKLYQVEVPRGHDVAHIKKDIFTGHQFNFLKLHLDKHYSLTYSRDGFVFVRSNDFKDDFAFAQPHHRRFGGVKKAFVDFNRKYLISLGHSNILTCLQLKPSPGKNDMDDQARKQMKYKEFLSSTKLQTMFGCPVTFVENQFYGELAQKRALEEDEADCRQDRLEILEEFDKIKEVLQNLITENLSLPEKDQLDMREFILDTNHFRSLKQKNEQDCLRLEEYYKELIQAQDTVVENIRKQFWDNLEVKEWKCYGLYNNVNVQNYKISSESKPKIPLAVLQHNLMDRQELAEEGSFYPWRDSSEESLMNLFQGQTASVPEVSVLKKFQNLYRQTELDITMLDTLQKSIIPEMVSEPERQVATYHQAFEQNLMSAGACRNIMEMFNHKFDQLRKEKEFVMKTVKDYNSKLRHAISEINLFTHANIDLALEDPEWRKDELSENFLTVEEGEVGVTPYLTPSAQELVEAQKAEELRLLNFRDEFRERTLIKMMNGKIEFTWEDLLHLDVPKPKCMEEKEPENYTQADLKEIRAYDDKVAELEANRLKYVDKLEVEREKYTQHLNEIVKKFNDNLMEVLLYKSDVHVVIIQEYFKINRYRLNFQKKMDFYQEEKRIKDKIALTEKVLEQLQVAQDKLQGDLEISRQAQENAGHREKTLDKALKKDMHTLPNDSKQMALKIYRKRPKYEIRPSHSAETVFELSKCFQSKTCNKMLPEECFEYVKHLEELESQIPPSINEDIFYVVNKHRRQRVEFETKMKAISIEMADYEMSLRTISKRMELKEATKKQLIEDLEKVREKRLHHIHNIQIQVSLPSGSVEVPLTGHLSDFEDCILISKEEVESVNEMLLTAAQKKIALMTSGMALRRKVMELEWKHRRKQMIIEDYKSYMNDINEVRVTKELLDHIKLMTQNFKIQSYTFDAQIDLQTFLYKAEIVKKQETLEKIRRKIHSIKLHNKKLDKQIQEANVEVGAFKLENDPEVDGQHQRVLDEKMSSFVKRSKLVKKIQKNHSDMLVLQTELELLRLRRYPTFKYQVVEK